MSAFPGSPRVLKGGLVLLDPGSGAVLRVIALQYNPDLVTRTLAPQSVGGTAERAEPFRLKAPPIETIKLDAELDATDSLELASDPRHRGAVEAGILPQLAALETIVYPTVRQLQDNDRLARAGTLEIAPMQAPLTLFAWSKNRVVPVRITDFSVVEDAFDPGLHPLRAKVTLGMRVLSVNDFGFDHRGSGIYLVYQQQKEALARRDQGGTLATFGIGALP
jgi:hypothetical protein